MEINNFNAVLHHKRYIQVLTLQMKDRENAVDGRSINFQIHICHAIRKSTRMCNYLKIDSY